ncbi:protein SRG1-like [Diospyros lotus]|uniref:protein SRG1-like n=1 Tax=Diospyros lotus TaxID=55363 RepID=UPI00224D34E3|nr:protein SRG1-like [Diospyros lotus]
MAAKTPENLLWSLPVPSVKELAMKGLATVPARYIRDDVEECTSSDPNQAFLGVPLIDMDKLVNPETRDMEVHKLHAACKDWGAFQLINHGLCSRTVRSMKAKTEEFFNLDLEEKQRWAQKPGSLEGYGQAFVISEDQKLEWCDMIYLRALPLPLRNLGFWPATPHGYREAIESYCEGIRELAVSLMGFIAKGLLGVGGKRFSEAFEDGRYELRMNCYPPCPEPEKVVGIAPHADISGITFLLDCRDVAGLQVQKDGHWFTVRPIADAIVVNLGHILEITSNGIYKAPQHRAIVDRWKERLSVVAFCYPSPDTDIGPAKELIEAGRPALYRTLKLEEYFKRFYDWNLGAVPFIDTLKL